MPFANFKVPAGTLSAAQKQTIIHRTTDLYAEIYGEQARANTLVLVEEVADGGWGIGDNVLTLAVLGGGRVAGDNPGEPAKSQGSGSQGS
jgi:4-oxalocrotonate tautomerase